MTADHDTNETGEPGYLRSYGRRRGKKLRPGRERLMDEMLPRISVKRGTPVTDQFPPDIRELWMEIGFGGGEHLAAQAQGNPDVGIIGCEPFLNGVAKLLSLLDEHKSENVRLYADDARDIFPDIADGALDQVFVLFPDPWPKARHHKRRLIQTPLLDDLARMLKDGGEFRFASDHMGYVRWVLSFALKHPDFEWMAEGPSDWRDPPDDWTRTRYEQKALAGDVMVYLRFRRKPRG